MSLNKSKILKTLTGLLLFAAIGCSNMLDVPVNRNPGITTASPTGGYSVAMLNGTLDITVVLDKMPQADVTIPVHFSDTTYADIDVTTLTFTPSNWYKPQIITITGGGFAGAIPNQSASIVFDPAVSSDPVYNNMFTPSIPIVIIGNIPGITVSPTSGLKTYKSGTDLHAAAAFTVVLNTKPSASVNLSTIASSAVTQGTIDKSSLTFTTLNWNTPQTITVTGVDNGIAGEGDVPYTVNLGAATSGDGVYNGMTPSNVSVINIDDLTRPALIVTPNAVSNTVPMMLIETATGGALGASGTFTVSLASVPSGTVIYNIASSVSGRVTVNNLTSTTVTFTPTNWNITQTFTVRPVTNHTGNKTLSIVVGADSTILANTVPVTVLDNLSPNVIVTSLSNPTDGSGTTAYFDVYLTTAPTQDVVIPINEKWDLKNNANQQGTIDKTSLTFTSLDYATPKRVTVTGVDDHIVNGNIQYYIYLGNTVSSDSAYNGIKPRNVTVNNNEINVAGIIASQTSGFATDTQGNLGSVNATFTIRLNSKPKYPVTLTLACATGYGTLSTSTLYFTTSDTSWSTPQTVHVTGNTTGAGHAGNYSVTITKTTADPEYNAVSAPSISIYNCDNTTNSIAYCRLSGASTNTTQGGGTAVFWLITKTIPVAISIPVSSSNTTAGGTVSTASLNLTSANWNTLGVSNKVTVTGVYSGDFENNVVYSIIFGAATGDAGTLGYLVPQVSATNTHISLLSISSVSTSSDLGGIGSFTVKLNVQPSSDVTFIVYPNSYASGVGFTLGTIVVNISLTFTNSNWNTAQTVYIQGDLYDGVRGDKTSTVYFSSISSADSGMNGYTPPASNAVTCKEANKLVWVSNKTYVGNFNGGVTQVDFNSTDATDTNRPTGIGTATYKALIADGVNRVATTNGTTNAGQTGWVLQANRKYYHKTGSIPYTTVLFETDSYSLPTGLSVGFTSSSSDTFWTGLNSNWTTSANTCGQWKLDATIGEYGEGGTTGSTALDAGDAPNTVQKKLIFVQQ